MDTLPRSLGLPTLIALGAAGVLGTSWIYTNGFFFARYGAGGEIAGLALAMVVASSIALAYAELAARMPRAGGEVVYAEAAFGRPLAFVAGWLLVGAYLASLAFYITAAGSLLAPIWPGIQHGALYSIAGKSVHAPALAIGLALAVSVYALNVRGAALGGRIQLLLFVLMVSIGLALAVTGFSAGRLDNAWPAWSSTMHPLIDTLRFVLPAMTFLTGFSLVTLLAEDADLSSRGIAVAAVSTVVVAGLFYLAVLAASAWIIPWQITATLPRGTIDAFARAGFPGLARAALGIAGLGLLTSFIALFLAASRVILALARLGLLPGALARCNTHGMPVPALRATLALSIGLGLLGPGALIGFLDAGGIYIGLAWLIGVACFYRLRARDPAQTIIPRALAWFPGAGALVAAAVVLATWLPGSGLSLSGPAEYVGVIGWLGLGGLVYGRYSSRSPA